MQYSITLSSRSNSKNYSVSGNDNSFECPICHSSVKIQREPIGATSYIGVCTCDKCNNKFTVNR